MLQEPRQQQRQLVGGALGLGGGAPGVRELGAVEDARARSRYCRRRRRAAWLPLELHPERRSIVTDRARRRQPRRPRPRGHPPAAAGVAPLATAERRCNQVRASGAAPRIAASGPPTSSHRLGRRRRRRPPPTSGRVRAPTRANSSFATNSPAQRPAAPRRPARASPTSSSATSSLIARSVGHDRGDDRGAVRRLDAHAVGSRQQRGCRSAARSGTARRRSPAPAPRAARPARTSRRRRPPRSRAWRAASRRSRGPSRRPARFASRSPARARSAASVSARNRQVACSRSSVPR